MHSCEDDDSSSTDVCDETDCSHVCFTNLDGVAECACPADLTLGEDGTICEDVKDCSSSNNVSDHFINDDGTWRPLVGFPDYCVTKKYREYSIGQPYALGPCNANKRKSLFAYDQETGFLRHNSDKEEWNNFCVQAQANNNSKLKVGICDSSNTMMIWDFDNSNGHVYLRDFRSRCMVVGPISDSGDGSMWMKISNKCASNTFGRFLR